MNKGKRLVRNTALALYALPVLFVGVNRLHASMAESGAPAWLRNAVSLGLRQESLRETQPSMALADARDFSRVLVVGRFDVEVVGGPDYKLTALMADGSEAPVHVAQAEGLLRVVGSGFMAYRGGSTGALAKLRIEVPSLEGLSVRASALAMQGLQGEALQVRWLGSDGELSLRQNSVAKWKLVSGPQLQVLVDDITFAAGAIETTGNVSIRRNP